MRSLTTALLLFPAAAFAQAPGLTQSFPGTALFGWFGGSDSYSNPGAGGVQGASDGYLSVTNLAASNFGAADFGANFSGNLSGNNIGGIVVWLRQFDGVENMEIHLALGLPRDNFWQFNAPLLPSRTGWSRHYIRLSNANPAQWTQIQSLGAATLAQAISNNQRLLFRHDRAPFVNNPDPIAGVLGIDEIRLTPVCPGETNGDNRVDFADLNTCLSQFGQTGVGLAGDVNNDGVVNFIDLNIILGAFGTTC